jgi:hypothetical protein
MIAPGPIKLSYKLINRWYLFLESLLKTNYFIFNWFSGSFWRCLVAHYMDNKPIEVLPKLWILMFVYFILPRDEILVHMYLLAWPWIDCPQTICDNSGHANKWKNQCLFVWLVYCEMCCMLMQRWFRTNLWCSFLSLWFRSGLGYGLGIMDGQIIHDEHMSIYDGSVWSSKCMTRDIWRFFRSSW